MTSLTTEDFPYTIGYVMELLGLDERELMSYVQVLGLSPRRDEKTSRIIFTHRDIEMLKKARDMKKHGEDLSTISRQLGTQPQAPVAPQANTGNATGGTMIKATAKPTEELPTYLNATSNQSIRTSGKDNITSMVEAVSQVKEGILKDLSRLLDDKLSGLDEVVVELIRCKSENDSLKKKLDEALRSKDALEHELSRFKPVQFGFFRKT